MKQMSATHARKQFFTLLDLAVKGEEVVIERNGIPLRLVRAKKSRSKKKMSYLKFIQGSVDQADNWSWEWDGSQSLHLKEF